MLALLAIAHGRDTSVTNLARVFLDLTFQFGLPFFIIIRSVRTPDDYRYALAGLAGGPVILSVLACYEAFRAWPLYFIAWGHYGIEWAAGVKLRGGLMRAAGPYPEPTSFAFNLCIGILAILAGRTLWSGQGGRLVLFGLSGAAILATQTRGAWIGLVMGLIIYYVTIGNARRARQVTATIGVAAAAIIGLSTVSSSVANLTGMTAEGQGTVDYRQRLFDRGIEEIGERPLLGASRDEVVRQMRDMIQGEGIVDFVNTYIYIGLISGLIGLIIFLTAIVVQATLAWTTSRRWPKHRAMSGFGLAALVSVLSMLTVTSLIGSTGAMLSVTFAMISAWSGLVEQGPRRDRTPGLSPPEESPVIRAGHAS
jgi:O-antigen ligase